MSFSVASGRTSREKKKLLGDVMILVISFVFYELCFILALREHLTVCATEMWCIHPVRVACAVGDQTSPLLLRQQKCRTGTWLTENNAKCRCGGCTEIGNPKALCRVWAFIRAAQSFNLSLSPSLSTFIHPPVLQQFWEGSWCVPSPALKEVSELLGHERKICAKHLPLCFIPQEKLRLLRELKHRKI